MIDRWLENVLAVPDEEVKSEARYKLLNGQPAPKTNKEIIQSINRKEMRPGLVVPKQLPNDALTAISEIKKTAYRSL